VVVAMHARTDHEIRASLANASRSEREAANLPDLTTLRWGDLDVLGWRAPKAPQRGYLVIPTDTGLRGLVLRAPQTRISRTAQCLLCQTVHQDNVALFVAKRPRGNGSSVGTYMCDDLQCSRHLRTKPLDLEARSRHLVASALGFLIQVTG
jgi:uncharacterized protein YlaI